MARIIDGDLIKSTIDFPELIDQIKKYYRMLKEERVAVTNRTFSPTKDGGLFIIGGATNFENENYIVMNQIVMPWLGEKALPVATTSYFYSNFRTGEIKAVVAGEDIVKYRTPAKSALAAKYLAADKEEYTLGLIGLGIQAVTHAQAFSSVFNVTKILGTSRTPDKWQHNIDEMNSTLDIEVQIVSKEELIEQADIIVVITSSKDPIVRFSDLHKGQLIIGTDHTETVAKDVALNADKVFADYRATAENENAAIKMLLAEGNEYDELVDGDLLQLSSGELIGRESNEEIIFFQSLGVMIENLAGVEYLYEKVGKEAEEIEF